ncbi:MAG: hypothetical protein ABSE16_13770 [Verrucomicrobiota bacterium]|jgi:hypothetical protein
MVLTRRQQQIWLSSNGANKIRALLKLLLDSGRYKPGEKPFQLVVAVDLKDGGRPIEVEVEFLASREVKLKTNRPKLLAGFRVLQADACGTAFYAPVKMEVSGKTVRGADIIHPSSANGHLRDSPSGRGQTLNATEAAGRFLGVDLV